MSADAAAKPKPTPLASLFEPYLEGAGAEAAPADAAEQVVLARLKREVAAAPQASGSPLWEIVVERGYVGELAAGQSAQVVMDCAGEAALVVGSRWLLGLRREEGGVRCVERGALEDGNFWGLAPSFAEVLAAGDAAHPARRAAEATEAKLLKALSADLGRLRCELPEHFYAGVLLWPDGRRERFMRLREHRSVALNRGSDERQGAERLSEAEAACLGEALEASRGPRFEGRAVVLNLLASRVGAARRDVKAWRWSGCGEACGQGPLLWPPYERVLSEAMFVALVERDLRPAQPTIGHGAMGTRSWGEIDIFEQTCLLRGAAAMRALDLSLPRSAHGWLYFQQMLCAARWGERDELRQGSFMLSKEVASAETLSLLKALSSWHMDDEASLLKAWRSQAGFASRAELYAALSRRQPLPLEFSPWLLHARGFLLERINPTRHDEAVALVLLAGRLSKDEAARYEEIAAQMGVTPRSVALMNQWVSAREAREVAGQEQLKAVESAQREFAASAARARTALGLSIWRAGRGASVASQAGSEPAAVETSGLTWLQELLLAAIAAAALVLGWVVFGRRRR